MKKKRNLSYCLIALNGSGRLRVNEWRNRIRYVYTGEWGDNGGAHKTEQISLLIDYLNLMNEIFFFSVFFAYSHICIHILFYFSFLCIRLEDSWSGKERRLTDCVGGWRKRQTRYYRKILFYTYEYVLTQTHQTVSFKLFIHFLSLKIIKILFISFKIKSLQFKNNMYNK